MEIIVTQKHIDKALFSKDEKGQCNLFNPRNCAITKAMNEKGFEDVLLTEFKLQYKEDGETFIYPNLKDSKPEIHRFVRGDFRPFVFQI